MEVEYSSFVEIFAACVLKRSVRVSYLLCVGEMRRTHEVLNLLPAHPSTAGLEKGGFQEVNQGTLYLVPGNTVSTLRTCIIATRIPGPKKIATLEEKKL